jgi:hypothetical protein
LRDERLIRLLVVVIAVLVLICRLRKFAAETRSLESTYDSRGGALGPSRRGLRVEPLDELEES